MLGPAAAGGVLRNIGITFETDNSAGFPHLNASACNVYGRALGVESLFALDRQLVVELVFQDRFQSDKYSAVIGHEFALVVRY